jgi:hypothetical protein
MVIAMSDLMDTLVSFSKHQEPGVNSNQWRAIVLMLAQYEKNINEKSINETFPFLSFEVHTIPHGLPEMRAGDAITTENNEVHYIWKRVVIPRAHVYNIVYLAWH